MEHPESTDAARPVVDVVRETAKQPLRFAYEEGESHTDQRGRFSLLRSILEGVDDGEQVPGKKLVPYVVPFAPKHKCIILISPERVIKPDGTARQIGSAVARKARTIDGMGRFILVESVRKGTAIQINDRVALIGRGLYCIVIKPENLKAIQTSLVHLDARVDEAIRNGQHPEAQHKESTAAIISSSIAEGVARVLACQHGATAHVTVDVEERGKNTHVEVKIEIIPKN